MNSAEKNDRKMISEKNLYQISLIGAVDQTRIDWFAKIGLEAYLSQTATGSVTILTGRVMDQAHLRGLLSKLWDLNFEVIQVSRLETNEKIGVQKNG